MAILTVNSRLAQQLHKDYQRAAAQSGRTVWETPTITPIGAWVTQQWQRLTTKPKTILSAWQALSLWQNIIGSDSPYSFFATAKQAQQALDTIYSWNLSLDDIDNRYNDEVHLFCTWAREFERRCAEQNSCCNSQLNQQLIKLLQHQTAEPRHIKLPKNILLAGFDEFTPSQLALIEQLKNVTDVTLVDPPKHSATITRVEPNDAHSELEAMARLAQQHYLKNPHAKIGCIIPNLGNVRDQVEHIFTDIFMPERHLPGNIPAPSPFNISAGVALANFDIIQIALQTLELCNGAINLNNFAHLIQSPYLAKMEDDMNMGALADAQLRSYGKSTLPLNAIFPVLTKLLPRYPNSTLLMRWRMLSRLATETSTTRTPSEWVAFFHQALSTIGWPGVRTRNSQEYQLITRWQKLLSEFSELDHTVTHYDFTEALNVLNLMATQTVFQAEGSNQSIQIMGVLESANAEFDHLWMAGLHDGTWPAAAAPNPFLPYPLQVAHNMPHVDANKEYHYAKQITQRLLSSAPNIVVSSPAFEGDQPLTASRLIADFPATDVEQLLPEKKLTFNELIHLTHEFESINDQNALAVNDNEHIKGGSWILAQQAACPFRAFASVRLQANALDTERFGIAPADRGILLHDALDRVWLALGDQQQLKQLEQTALMSLIENTVDQVISEQQNSSLCESTQMLDIERTRLINLIVEWLELEIERQPFTVIQRETRRAITIDKLSMHIQIDRIDALADGSEVVIDYKTGLASTAGWLDERLQNPQLPLYCAYGKPQDQTPYAGAIIAQVQPGKCAFKGIMSEQCTYEPTALKNVLPLNRIAQSTDPMNWSQLIAHWQEQLTELAKEFNKGAAAVEPINAAACQYCQLQPLCRIGEHN